MTKSVSNREICFIKAVLLLCEHGHFKKKIENGVNSPLPLYIRVKGTQGAVVTEHVASGLQGRDCAQKPDYCD